MILSLGIKKTHRKIGPCRAKSLYPVAYAQTGPGDLLFLLFAEFEVNAEAQVVKGNKAAGARARKAALALMKDLKEFRKVSVEASK